MTLDYELRWRRSGRGRVRPRSEADRTGLRLLYRAPSWRWVAGTSRPSELEHHDSEPSLVTVVLERDLQVVGAGTIAYGRVDVDLGRFAWSELAGLSSTDGAPDPVPVETGVVRSLGWRERPATRPLQTGWIVQGLQDRSLRRGVERVVVPVRLRARRIERSPYTAAAYLQQCHYRSLDDPDLAPFFECDFELRGFWPGEGDEPPTAALLWRASA